jgi:hypothetical protein
MFLEQPPIDNLLPHFFSINVKIIQHNKNIFENMFGETFTFFA